MKDVWGGDRNTPPALRCQRLLLAGFRRAEGQDTMAGWALNGRCDFMKKRRFFASLFWGLRFHIKHSSTYSWTLQALQIPNL
jgi:hypothetical protein